MPPVWTANTPVIDNVTVVVPTVDNGCMYECVSGGRTGLTEPTWSTIEDDNFPTVDGGAEWKCIPRNSVLKSGDVISASTWTGDTGCTLDNPSVMDSKATKVRVTAVPADADAFTLVNHVTVTRLSGDVEEFDRSLYISITQT